jgi:hypothetical protein
LVEDKFGQMSIVDWAEHNRQRQHAAKREKALA